MNAIDKYGPWRCLVNSYSGDVVKNLNTKHSEIPNFSLKVHFCVQTISVCFHNQENIEGVLRPILLHRPCVYTDEKQLL